jgi:hypothetical protein
VDCWCWKTRRSPYEGDFRSKQAFTAHYKGKKQQKKKPSEKPTSSEDNSKDKKASKVICWNCGEKGHKKPDCKKPKKGKEKEEESKDQLFLIEDNIGEDVSLTVVEKSARNDNWYVDSGATKYTSNRKEWYKKLDAVSANSVVALGDNSTCAVKGKGAIPVKTAEGSLRALDNVLYIPSLCKNLLSVSALTKQKLKVIFDEKEVVILDKAKGDKVVARGVERNGLYQIIGFAGLAREEESQLWHERMGHLNCSSLAAPERW